MGGAGGAEEEGDGGEEFGGGDGHGRGDGGEEGGGEVVALWVGGVDVLFSGAGVEGCALGEGELD